MEGVIRSIVAFLRETIDLWRDGGWAMVAIAIAALVAFGVGMHVFQALGATGFTRVRERTWRRWIDVPEERRGPIGHLLDFVTAGTSLEDVARRFRQVRATEVAPFERDLKVMKVCVGAAPLLGLLGTVTGMLATFGALAHGSGGDETMRMISAGISEALITTETGLVVALPGVFFLHHLRRKHERLQAFLAHVETVCLQHRHGRTVVHRAAA